MNFKFGCRWARLIGACVLGVSLTARAAGPMPELTALTEQLPPLNMEMDGRVTGFSSELLDMMAADAGIPLRKQVLPWARAYDRALRHSDVILYSLVRTPERESLFRWVGPISPRRIVLYRWADRTDIVLKTLTMPAPTASARPWSPLPRSYSKNWDSRPFPPRMPQAAGWSWG